MPRGALEARPAEVLYHVVAGVRQAVDLLPGVLSHVARPDLVRARPEREAERVAQAVGDDPVRAGGRIDLDDRAVEPEGVAGGARVLGAQRAALVRRVVAGVAELPEVARGEARSVPGPD